MDFPLYFQKPDVGGGGTVFWRTFFLEKPNTVKFSQVLVVMHYYSPRPNMGLKNDMLLTQSWMKRLLGLICIRET